ncbi:gamma-carotene 1'-hydroxylase CruF [Chamaesiphon sp. VAR_69_metabat_338]|uniref:gamma-carotene 1'-hydroxylase CruF n=1 Tax=Chamaesiphon sp. VAR_69_metabat_338 TaxID=2964704 RepID=UPI00286D97FE|nr:carotenoid biosynthesis protein [Chamaesiphon sp. VAR_69_metabat_338]
MEKLIRVERTLLIGHIISMAFGLAGILLVLPNADFIAALPDFGKTAFGLSMAGGGVAYMILGTGAVAVYAYRTLGLWHCLGFMVPAIGLSLVAELLGTSTGFPFGHYHYLSGLGYKIAGLVPFTIPLSWFYVGFSAYTIARAGLETIAIPQILKYIGAIGFGSLLLTSWDFVLDPGMSQTTMPFWVWEQPGAFFGMPYENFVGWFGTGVVFMTVATFIWRLKPLTLSPQQLGLPLAVYTGNFAFATIMSITAGFYITTLLGLVLGILPLMIFYQMATTQPQIPVTTELEAEVIPVQIANDNI